MEKEENRQFIKLDPTWVGLYPFFCQVIDYGTPESKQCLKEELLRLCKCADDVNAQSGNETSVCEDMAKAIVNASLYWTGEDEEKNPELKRARTLAGLYLREGEASEVSG